MSGYCCEEMEQDLTRVCSEHPERADCPDALIGRMRGGYGILVHDGGTSMIEIAFCPWCGTKLPPIAEVGDTARPTADDDEPYGDDGC